MNTEFSKQLAVCDHYHKKTDFWGRILWLMVLVNFIGLFIPWPCIDLILMAGYLVAFIPACVRLWQYGRAVNKLGEKVGK